MRFAICLLGFFAFDAVAIWYVMPKWKEMIDPKTETPALMPKPEADRQTARTVETHGPMTVKSTDLGHGFKCAGGLLYQTSETNGVKTITIHTIEGRASRCE